MVDLAEGIPLARNSVVALLRIHLARPATIKKGKPKPAVYEAAMVGTAFCVVNDRYLVTAHHVFNNREPRRPNDKFYALIVPNNGLQAFHYPVVAFPLEDAAHDMAVIEIGPCTTPGQHLSALPITTSPQVDGAHVFTVGFPSPAINSLSLDDDGTYRGGEMFLKSYANEGIVSAQFQDLTGTHFYELNVDWHHGESGGPILRLSEPPAVFSMMQQYRPIQGPHGVIVGPHQGRGLSCIETHLRSLGATFVER